MTAPTSPRQQRPDAQVTPAIDGQIGLLSLPEHVFGIIVQQMRPQDFGSLMQVSKGALILQ